MMDKKIYLNAFRLPAIVLILIVLATLADEVLALQLPLPASLLPLAIGGGCVCYDTLTAVWHSRKITAGILVVLALVGSLFTGEYMEGAEVAFMMLLGESLEDLAMTMTQERVNNLVKKSGFGSVSIHSDKTGNTGRLADRFSEYFLPLILIIGAIVWFITQDIRRVMTIFVIACPCSLMLSSPIAILTCIGNAAKKGILLMDGETVERCGSIGSIEYRKEKGLYVGDNGLTLGFSKDADVILPDKEDATLSYTLALTKRTHRIIWQNILIFACCVNLAGILLSSLGLLNPLLGAIIHNASTICVVLNSLRLLK